MKKEALVFISFLFLCQPGKTFDFQSSKSMAMGRTYILSNTSPSTLVSTATGNNKDREWGVEISYSRRFDLSELRDLFVASSYKINKFQFGLGLRQFGSRDFYAERTMKGSIGYNFRTFVFGLSLSGMMIDIGNNYGRLRAAGIGLSSGYNYKGIYAVVSADDLNSPKFTEDRKGIKPFYSLLTEYKSNSPFSILFSLKMQKLEKPQLGIGQQIELSNRASFHWGLGSNPTIYGGGLEMKISQAILTYSVAIHPVLGQTHKITLAYGNKKILQKQGPGFDRSY